MREKNLAHYPIGCAYLRNDHSSGPTLIQRDPSRLLRKVPARRGVPRPAAEYIISRALTHSEERVALMITLGSGYGLRRGEIAQVSTRDLRVDPDGEWSLVVHGKGAKDRIVPLLPDVAAVIRDAPAGWLFPSTRPYESGRHLSPAWVVTGPGRTRPRMAARR